MYQGMHLVPPLSAKYGTKSQWTKPIKKANAIIPTSTIKQKNMSPQPSIQEHHKDIMQSTQNYSQYLNSPIT